MRPIYENTVIQIDVTNACHLSCRHCTRHVGHHRKPFFIDLDYLRKAISSILDSPCRIGIMGGEPTMHPQFLAILDIVEEMVPNKARREFWSAGFRFGVYKDRIYQVFDKERIAYNDHVSYDGRHTPLLVAIDEVVDDTELKAHLIANCGFQTHWSASITPKGGYFCEIAASLGWLFDIPGYDISDRRWWDRTPAQFQDQVEQLCGMCSGAIPMPADWTDGRGGRDGITTEQITPGMLAKLKAVGSPKVNRPGGYELWTRKIDREWVARHGDRNTRSFRSFVAHSPEDVAAAQEVRPELMGCRACA